MTRVRTPLIAPGSVVHQFSAPEAEQLAEEWLAVFGQNRHGVNTKAYLWHVFSGARYPNASGAEALQQYKRRTGEKFVVLSNDRELAFVTELLPESSSLADYYVFPRNLAWTMAFTHEDGWLGPYFARHPDFAKLDAENQSALEKRRQAEVARRNGWA